MKADKIIKNAKIFTSDKDNLLADAMAVKDGHFVYVGDEAGLSEYEGEVTDLGGKFIMPGIIDTHIHITFGAGYEFADMGERFECDGKQGALDFISDHMKKNPGQKRYKFMLNRKYLKGEALTKEDLDAICPDDEIIIVEEEGHSVWLNSRVLALNGITDETPDAVPGLSYYERKDGHLTGRATESSAMPFQFDNLKDVTDEQIKEALLRWIDYSVHDGVTGVFDAGFPANEAFHERVYNQLRELDKEGKLPVYVDGCYILTNPYKLDEVMEGLKRYQREYNTEHLKVHTFKLILDGTLGNHTAAMVTPYEGTEETGATTFDAEGIAKILKLLNEAGLDLHVHTVGERSSRIILDGVELARKELKDSYRVKVTAAHLEIQDDADLSRFAELGVFANFTPHWHAGDMKVNTSLLGRERAMKMYRCKTLWDSGALVTWSSDNIAYDDFMTWSPYLGMEVGMTRLISEKTRAPEYIRNSESFPPAGEKMSIEEMILGYTINGAKQLGIEASKGSIEAGKDADFLVFDNDLLTAEHEGFSYNKPTEVYICGKKVS